VIALDQTATSLDQTVIALNWCFMIFLYVSWQMNIAHKRNWSRLVLFNKIFALYIRTFEELLKRCIKGISSRNETIIRKGKLKRLLLRFKLG
jgi:hypothetical protein